MALLKRPDFNGQWKDQRDAFGRRQRQRSFFVAFDLCACKPTDSD